MKRQSIHKRILALTLVVISVCLLGFVGKTIVYPYIASIYPSEIYPEVIFLEGKTYDFGQLSNFFTKLAETKGAVYAFTVLKVAPIPPNTDMHLLGHVVGDILYKQKGMEGITACTNDFRNACSHSIVVGYYLKYGESGLPQIADTCRKAPGGSGAYTMCFHGLGHGVLAALDYDLPKTISLCQKNGTPQYGFREAPECVGGAIMEIISGGFHNKTLWEQASKRYLKTDDALYPCNSDMVPVGSKAMCYEYLTPHLVHVAGGDLNESPTEEVLTKAFSYCKQIENEHNRADCFAGFGKEFIVLAAARDIRDFNSLTDAEIDKAHTLCRLAHDEAGEQFCVTHAVDSLYWGGENSSKPAIRFCERAIGEPMQATCFSHLIGAMYYFMKDSEYRRTFCSELPEAYKPRCESYE
jgi:hypothetical protein